MSEMTALAPALALVLALEDEGTGWDGMGRDGIAGRRNGVGIFGAQRNVKMKQDVNMKSSSSFLSIRLSVYSDLVVCLSFWSAVCPSLSI